jgi:PIN domain nuclease of toxin-antitoxin system
VVLGLGSGRAQLLRPQKTALTLLDTNALIWLHVGHRRVRALGRGSGKLYVSPASLLEAQFLMETGRLRLRRGASPSELAGDPRLLLDDPPAAAWFDRALGVGWTHDPFDRLIVAHAEVRNWRLATGDEQLLERLGSARAIAL